jgi:hypothetical protein
MMDPELELGSQLIKLKEAEELGELHPTPYGVISWGYNDSFASRISQGWMER